MKKLVYFPVAILVLVLFLGCSKEPVAPEVTISDANEDGVWHAGPKEGVLGNTDIWFIPETLQGSAIWVLNGPGNAIGFDVAKKDDPSLIYFADSYIGAGDYEAQTGTLIPEGQWIHLRVVVYKNTLPGWVISFLEFLQDTFFSDLDPSWIEEVYEADVLLVPGGGIHSISWEKTTHQYLKE